MKYRRNRMGLRHLLPGCLVAVCCAGFMHAPFAHADSLSELKDAVSALQEENEEAAWQIFSDNGQAFQKNWKDLDPSFVVWVADQYRKQKRYDDALSLVDGLLAKEGNLDAKQASKAMLVRGDTFRDRGNYAAARMEYQQIERNKEYKGTEFGKEARFRVVDILRLTKDYEGAEDILERLKDYPDPETQAQSYYYSALIAFDRGSYDEAREYIAEVKKRVPEHVETLFLEAKLNLIENRLQDPELEIGSRVLMTYVVPGRPITMKMQDSNLAVVRGGAGIPVRLITTPGGDVEDISLLPSPRDPTLFRGSIATKLGQAATNSLSIELTGSDVVQYNLLESFQKANDLNYEEKKMVVVSDGELAITSGEFIPEEEREELLLKQRLARAAEENLQAHERVRDLRVVRPGNPIRVQVTDYDRDVSGQADSVFVSAETSTGDRVDGIELKETETHSGIFQGEIPTVSAPPRATASGSAGGTKPGSPVSISDNAVWQSAAGEDKSTWYEVDLMTVHPLEEATMVFAQGGTGAITLFGGSDEKMSPIASTAPSREVKYGYVDLARHFGEQQQTAAYLYTEVTSEGAQAAVFKIGSADGVSCWLNGERVHLNLGGRMWAPEQDVVNVNLKAGINAVLLRVKQLTGPWGASLTILTADGKPLPSLPSYPSVAPGVVTEWNLFDRLTPEEIQVAERIPMNKPIRIGGKAFAWVKVSTAPAASLVMEGSELKTVFHKPVGFRRLKWVFDGASASVAVKEVRVTNKFGDTVVPSEVEFSTASSNRILELGPGDGIEVTYKDERRIRPAEVLMARMMSGFYNARLTLAYESIGMDVRGNRTIVYGDALRYRAGDTEKLVARVVDFDADTSVDLDKVKVLVENSEGEQVWFEALETKPHSGVFLAIVRLGANTGGDTIRVGPGIDLTASYSDRENSDGQIAKTDIVREAADDPPELILYQSVVMSNESGLGQGSAGKRSVKVQLPRDTGEGKPVVTSLDTSLVFNVVYPAAALSSNSQFVARLVTQREIEEAKKEGREPRILEYPMDLSGEQSAEFEARVPLRVGEESEYADVALNEAAADGKAARALFVKGDDLVNVIAKGIASDQEARGQYRLASDGMLGFTDRDYKEQVGELYLGDYLYLRLSDRDRDSGEELDEVNVALSSGASSRDITLVETFPHSGLFTGRIKTEPLAQAADGTQIAATGRVFSASYGETITASYKDDLSVLSDAPRTVTRTVRIHPGADGALATFTKRFKDQEIAVKTRLLTAEALFELAKEHRETAQEKLAEDEIAEGKQILEEAIVDYPTTRHAPHAEFLLANLAQELKKYEEALERYNRVLANWPDSEYAPRAQLKKGICLEKMEDYDNALDAYVELTYSYPESELVSDAVLRIGQHFYRTGEYQVAGKVFGNFHEYHSENPLAPKALFLSGQSYMKGAEARKEKFNGRYDGQARDWLAEGARKFSALVETYDDKTLRSEAMYWQATCYLNLGNMAGAYQALKKLTWDYPETKWAKFARGQLVQHSRDFENMEATR